MKKRIFALMLAALLMLSGCASMLDTEVVEVKDHVDLAATGEDPTAFRAETYTELVSAVDLMVRQGITRGTIRISDYSARPNSTLEEELAAACLEVSQEVPLGAYSVDFIKHELSYILSYYEAGISITYRRTQDQVKNIVSVTRTSAIREEIRSTLSKFASEAVLRVRYYDEDIDYIHSLIRQAYYDTPLAALGMPAVSVSLYPDAGTERIIEIVLTYSEDQEALRKKSLALAAKADSLDVTMGSPRGEAAAAEIYRLLRTAISYQPSGSRVGERLDTAYAALVDGRASSEGAALAFQLLAQLAGLECSVVAGTAEGTAHYWNIVRLSGGEYRHVDATLADGLRKSDADLVALGYDWDRDSTPLCGEQPPEPTPEPAGEGVEAAFTDGGTPTEQDKMPADVSAK